MILLLTACGVQLPDPRLTGVEPDRGWNGEPTVVSIEGMDLFPQVQIDLNQGGEADLDRSFVAWLDEPDLGRFRLSSVAPVDYEHLQAVVDPNLPAGRYDVLVEGPSGALARLDDAFTISATRADGLELVVSDVLATVNSPVQLSVVLLDPNELPVQGDMDVRLTVEGQGPFDLSTGFEDQERVDNVITGRLGADGLANFVFTVSTAGPYRLVLDAPNDPSISGDVVEQVWQNGDSLSVAIGLPTRGFEVEAGVEFPVTMRLQDQFGNVVDDRTQTVLLQSSCGDVSQIVSLIGEQVVDVVTTRATVEDSACDVQRLFVEQGAGGTSEPFAVRASTVQTLDVIPLFPAVRAGAELLALVLPRDAYDNTATLADTVELTDTVDGIAGSTCAPSLQSGLTCRASPTVAADGVELVARAGSFEGRSVPYQVLPDSVLVSGSVTLVSDAVAGVPIQFAVEALDAFGNQLLETETPPIDARTDRADEDCTVDGPLPDGRIGLSCSMNTARELAELRVDVGDLAWSSLFEVKNADPFRAEVTAPVSVEAGEAFVVEVEVFDAFDNPILVSNGVPIEWVDERSQNGATLSLTDGRAEVPLAFTLAGVTELRVQQSTVELGRSGPINVAAAPADSLQIEVDDPWAWVGEGLDLRVVARDEFGNRTADDFSASVSSTQGPLATVSAVNGAGALRYTFDTVGLDASLQAVGGGWSGESLPLDVFERCADGPLALLDFTGQPEGRGCLLASGVAVDVPMSMTDSMGQGAPLDGYRSAYMGEVSDSTDGLFVLSAVEEGLEPVVGLAFDDRLCASTMTSTMAITPNDGRPAGTVKLDGATSVTRGQVVPYTIGPVLDCTGDPVSGHAVRVRTTRGRLTAGVAPSGTGLEATLGTTGLASVEITYDQLDGGESHIRANGRDPGAIGDHLVTVVGDNNPPHIWEQTPRGQTSGLVSDAQIQFSEPLLPSSVVPSSFLILGPGSSTVLDAILLEPDRVQVVFDPPVDAGSGAWTLLAGSALRDAAGNRLDGEWSGAPSDYLGVFGLAPAVVDPVVCTADTEVFRPDGDDGIGLESDRTRLSMSTLATPADWIVEVTNADGRIVYQERSTGLSPIDELSWDGRSSTGAVLDDGDYLVRVEADDGSGNRGTGCAVAVSIANDR